MSIPPRPSDRMPAEPHDTDVADTPPADTPPATSVSLRKIVWSVLLSVAVLAFVASQTFHPGEFNVLLRDLNPLFLAAAVGSVVVRVVAGGWRLQYVSRGRLSFTQAVRGQLAWDFFSNVTPSAIGGGPIAVLYIARDRGIPVGEVTAIMLFSMLLDQLWFALSIPLLFLAALYLPLFPEVLGSLGTLAVAGYFVGILAWVVGFGYAILFQPRWLHRLTEHVFRHRWLRRFHGRVVRELEQLRERAQLLRAQPASFYGTGLFLTALTWVSRYVLPLLIVWSVFPDVEQLLFVLRTAAMMLGTLVLPTPGGSGGVEGLYVLFLGPLMPQALVAPTLLIWRVLGYYIFLALGVYLFAFQVQQSVRQRRRAATAQEAAEPAVPGRPDDPR